MVIADRYPTAWGRSGSRRKRLTSSSFPAFCSAKQSQKDEIGGNSASDGHLADATTSETAVELADFHNMCPRLGKAPETDGQKVTKILRW